MGIGFPNGGTSLQRIQSYIPYSTTASGDCPFSDEVCLDTMFNHIKKSPVHGDVPDFLQKRYPTMNIVFAIQNIQWMPCLKPPKEGRCYG